MSSFMPSVERLEDRTVPSGINDWFSNVPPPTYVPPTVTGRADAEAQLRVVVTDLRADEVRFKALMDAGKLYQAKALVPDVRKDMADFKYLRQWLKDHPPPGPPAPLPVGPKGYKP